MQHGTTLNAFVHTAFPASSRYLSHWFIVDFVASIPLEKFSSSDKGALNKLLRMLRVAKLFRLARLLRYSDSLRAAVHIQPSIVRLIQQMFGILWMWHVIACAYWSIVAPELDEDGDMICEKVSPANERRACAAGAFLSSPSAAAPFVCGACVAFAHRCVLPNRRTCGRRPATSTRRPATTFPTT